MSLLGERTVRFLTADVFTERPFGGNPLAVVPDADGLSSEEMRLIARELNLSETAFVLSPTNPGHTRRLRIFTPGIELPFAGHPTVGTALVLCWTGAVALQGERTAVVLEEGVGPVAVTVRAREGRAYFAEFTAARDPEEGPAPDPLPPERVSELVSLSAEDLAPGEEARAFSAGVPFLFVPLRDVRALGRAWLRTDLWSQRLAAAWAPHVYVFVREGERVRARMFAPAMGVTEDPATGAAAAALAGYLAGSGPEGPRRWVIEQGVEMGRPSRLEVEADVRGGRATRVRVGGGGVLMGEGQLALPPGERP